MTREPASRRLQALALAALALSVRCAAGSGAGASDGSPAAGSTSSSSASSSSASGGLTCEMGTVLCDGDSAVVCDGHGGYLSSVPCGAGMCEAGTGCLPCPPGPGSCAGAIGRSCNADRTATIEFECDATQGMTCTPGGCLGACTPLSLGASYLGCEYWPTVTMNSVWSYAFSFAVGLVNTASESTTVLIEGPSFKLAFVLMPDEARTVNLPWVQPLKGPDSDALASSAPPTSNNRGGAYRVRANHPIAAYQFNPLEYENPANPAPCPNLGFGKCYSYSNDASLLLPTNALTGDYYVVGYRTAGVGDLLAVTGTQDGTNVTITAGPKTRTLAGEGVDLAPGQSATVSLGRGETLQLFTQGKLGSQQWAGSTVTATRPVQVITGSPCAAIPNGVVACDHLEESVLPAETLGDEYAVTVPRTPMGLAGTPNGGRHVVRIHGVHDGTTLSYAPASVSSKTSINAGETIELGGVVDDFIVGGSLPFAVTQYMIGQGNPATPDDGGVGAGDPSQSIAIPTAQYRQSYAFIAPATFDESFVNIVAPLGLSVNVDGIPIASNKLTPIGGTKWGAMRWPLGKQPFHRASADKPFGIVVYAYGQYTSYMYPGGMDLARIAPSIPK